MNDLGDKAKDFLSSDKGEEVSDNVLQKGDDAAEKVTGGKFDTQIDDARDAADDKVGQ